MKLDVEMEFYPKFPTEMQDNKSIMICYHQTEIEF